MTTAAKGGCRRCGADPKDLTCRFEEHEGRLYMVQLVCDLCGAEGERREPGT